MMKRLLVTGAAGFIGRQVLRQLDSGWEVHATHRIALDADLLSQARWHAVDLELSSAVDAVLDAVQPSHLLHLAWFVEHGDYWSSPANLTCVSTALHLMRRFVEQGGERWVGAGTCAEYEWSSGCCSEDRTPLRPSSLYGNAKHGLRLILESHAQEVGLSFAWGRIFSPYGPHEDSRRLVPSVIGSLLRGEVARCRHASYERDFLHVSDVAAGFVRLLESPIAGAVNVSSGRPVAIREVVEHLARGLDGLDRVDFSAETGSQDEPKVLFGASDRLVSTGWQPTFDLESGLDDAIDWWRRRLGISLPK